MCAQNDVVLPQPDCFTVTVLSKLGGSNSALLMGTSDRLPSHPKQKMVEPQTAVSPLMTIQLYPLECDTRQALINLVPVVHTVASQSAYV